jgi:NADH-quinone oxidoreductase subunit C
LPKGTLLQDPSTKSFPWTPIFPDVPLSLKQSSPAWLNYGTNIEAASYMTELFEIEEIRKRFYEHILEVAVKNTRRVTVRITSEEIVAVSNYIVNKLLFRFIIASALETDQGIEILYHFSKDKAGLILNIRVILDKKNPVIESLTGLFEGSNWIEREMHEILGIDFKNHPNLEKLISEGNWAEGVFPYRKDEKGRETSEK